MKYSLTLSAILFLIMNLSFVGCGESEEKEEQESECLAEMMEEFKERNEGVGFTFISTFRLDGKTYYIFDNGTAFDATASVVDVNCKLLCAYGGFRSNTEFPCADYQDAINGATKIWPLD